MKIYLHLIFLALLVYTCVEPFEPEVGDYESTLVVDGLFSNSEDSTTVKLSRSFPYSEEEGIAVQGAEVVIEEDQGPSIQLKETKAGVYQIHPTEFAGKVGRSYRLRIRTPDGNQFESDWELMKPAPAIGDLRVDFVEKIPDDPTRNPIPGAQIYISTKDPENSTRYYRWEFVETYQYVLRFPPLIRVEYGTRPGNGEDEVFWILPDDFEGSRCWKTEESRRVLVATTENLTEDVIADFPLHFVDNSSSRLYTRYSLLVKQYALSETYFEFLKKINEINETTGGLFDPIPNEVFGNISNTDGKDIPVLGYFGVAGVSEKRIFIDREDVPIYFSAPYGPRCQSDTVDYNFRTLYSKTRTSLMVYDYLYSDFGDIIGFVLTEPPCASCAASEATNQKPDFW